MSNLPRIAYIDDSHDNLTLYSEFFKEEFYLDSFSTSEKLLLSPHLADYSAIMIDFYLTSETGIHVAQLLRNHRNYNGCPLVFISASLDEEIKLNCLENGAHDFFCRYMKTDEMILRIKNKINLFESLNGNIRLGNLYINLSDLKVYLNYEYIDTTLTEMKIIRFLIKNGSTIISRNDLYQYVWPGQKIMPTTLNTHMSNLRHKFASWEFEIVAEKSIGYKLRPKQAL